MPDIRLGQLDMDPREKKGPLFLKYNSVTALPIAEYLLPVSFDKEGILGSLFVSYRTLRVNWVDDLTFFRIIMWASTGAWEEVMNDCCWGSSRSPKDCITTNSWLHSCQRGKKCMNGPFSHDFLSSSSGSDINDLFEGKATLKYFKWAEETSSTYATPCTVLWSAFVIENPTTSISGGARNTVAWKEIVSRTATYLLQSFMNLACAVQSVKFLVLIGYFSSTLMHHTTAWTWYANWVQYVPAFILSQLGVWLMAMNLSFSLVIS